MSENFDFVMDDNNAPAPLSNTPIPAGWYQMTIEKAEIKPTNDGAGKKLNLQCRILGPSYANKVIFPSLNIKNKSEQTEEIAKRILDSLRRAMKIQRLSSPDQLVGGVVEAKVSVQVSKDPQYEDKNDVKQFREISGNAIPAPAQKAQPKAAGDTPPWQKEKPVEKKVADVFSDEGIPF